MKLTLMCLFLLTACTKQDPCVYAKRLRDDAQACQNSPDCAAMPGAGDRIDHKISEARALFEANACEP